MNQQPGCVATLRAIAGGTMRGWRGLPEQGWPLDVVLAHLKNPPRWFVKASLAAMALVGLPLLLWLVRAVMLGCAEDVSKLLLGLAGLLSAPFLVWRTWIADQQKTIADQQQKTAQETHYTNLLTKAVDQLGAMREEAAEDDKKRL